MFNKVNIGEGKKHDTTQVSEEGLSQEEILKATKKKKRLIDIYKTFDTNKDGNLDKNEIAFAMKILGSMDKDGDSKLSKKELKEGAITLNEALEEQGFEIKGKDLKAFLKSVNKATKGDKKQNVDEVIQNYIKEQQELAAKKAAQNSSVEEAVDTPPDGDDENSEGAKVEKAPELHTYTVQEGESFTGIIKRSLKAQGIENPTEEQIKDAKENFKKNNDGAVRTSSKGVEFVLVGAKVKLEGALEDKNNTQEQEAKYGRRMEAARAEREAARQAANDAAAAGGSDGAGGAGESGKAKTKTVKAITFTNTTHKNFNDLAAALLEKDGISNPTEAQIKQKAEDLKKHNKGLKDGELIGKKITAPVSDTVYNRIAKREQGVKSATAKRYSTVAIISKDLAEAKKAFQSQLKEDGWAGKTADALSAIWGSENRAVKVEADLKKHDAELNALRKCAKQGDANFKAKFKQIYGVEYNYDNIKAYKDNPSDENYVKAFGSTNKAAERVAKYNQSQQDGAAVVKGVAVGVAAGTAAVLTGGSSLLVTGLAVGGTTAGTRVVAEVTDKATNEVDGDLNGQTVANIAGDAVVEGAVAGVTAGVLKGVAGKFTKGGKLKAPPGENPPPPGAKAPGKTSGGGKAGNGGKTGGTNEPPPGGNNGGGKTGGTNEPPLGGGKAGNGGKTGGTNEPPPGGNNGGGKTGGTNEPPPGGGKAGNGGKTGGTNEPPPGSGKAGNGGKTGNGAAPKTPKQEFSDMHSKISAKQPLDAGEISKLEQATGLKYSELQHMTKAQYRKMVMKFHPDKLSGLPPAEREMMEEVFKLIQFFHTA